MSDGAARVFAPQGPLTMMTAAAVLDEGRQLAAQGDVVIDFAAVGTADSAALALVLAWLRSARARDHRLQLRNFPANLDSLAAVYDIDTLLPVESHA